MQASAEKLEQTCLLKKERMDSVPQRKLMASTPEPSLPRGEGTERLEKRNDSPEYQIMRGERVKVGESHTLAREGGIRAGA